MNSELDCRRRVQGTSLPPPEEIDGCTRFSAGLMTTSTNKVGKGFYVQMRPKGRIKSSNGLANQDVAKIIVHAKSNRSSTQTA